MARKTSFYYSFLVLPAEQRRAIIAVWDFCRAVDDTVDEIDEIDEIAAIDQPAAPQTADAVHPRRASQAERVAVARAALDGWRAELVRCYDGQWPQTPEGRQLQPFIGRFALPRQAFVDVIDGVAMDLDTSRYQTFDELLQYCHRVASAVGLICIRIFGCRDARASEYAVTLGVALQLTNIVRDVKDDLARGRVYLPLEDLQSMGCHVEDLAAGRLTDPVRQLLAFECRRAHEYYRRAIEVRPSGDRRRLVAAEIMRAVYFETLQRIERSGYDVFSGRARVPRPRQALIAARQWLWPS